MIQVTSLHLSNEDKKTVRKFAQFVLNKFVKTSVQRKSLIKINVVRENDFDNYADIDDLRAYNAWVVYEGFNASEKKVFNVVVNATQINLKAKKPMARLKKLLVDLGHELVHVKQYLNGEMFDYVAGGVRYKGSYFDHTYQVDEETYYESPWEIEAYGREWGLYRMFKTHIKEEE